MTNALTALFVILPILAVIPVHMMNIQPEAEEGYDMR